MQITGILGVASNRLAIRAQHPLAAARSAGRPSARSFRELQAAIARIKQSRAALRDVKEKLHSLGHRKSRNEIINPISLSANIDLDMTATAATVQSTDEINATAPTSYSPTQPQFSGSTTVTPTISGTYTGLDDDVYTFTVTKGGLHGVDIVRMDVTDQSGSLTDQLILPVGSLPSTTYTLSSGLVVSFSAGRFRKPDSFQVTVQGPVPQAVNPNNPFNGTGSSSPNFEPGVSVVAGSFQINGTSITVTANDSIQSVLDKINASAAGVTANFNTNTERVMLTSTTLGSAGQIVFSNDTSGFVSAVRLSSAVVTPGIDNELERAMSQVDDFDAVEAGDIEINATPVNEDPDADSLQDMIERINAANAGVTTEYDTALKKFRITQSQAGAPFSLDDGSTNFFDTLGIPTGSQAAPRRLASRSALSHRVSAVRDFAKALNDVVKATGTGESPLREGILRAASAELKHVFGSAAITNSESQSSPGIAFQAAGADRFATIKESELRAAIQGDPGRFQELFFGNERTAARGLVSAIDEQLAHEQERLEGLLQASFAQPPRSVRA